MFTEDELELLQEGLDAILSRKSSEMLNAVLLGTILSPTKEAAKEEADKLTMKMKEEEETNKALKNRITLLKAKLIQLSDKLAVSSAMEEMK